MPVTLSMPGAFLFKHIIGKEFRKQYCTMRGYTCSLCPSNADCVYGSILEPVVTKRNVALMGKDAPVQPIIMETSPFAPEEAVEVLLKMTFLGNAVRHIPLFYSALKIREDAPLFRTRACYTVNDVTDGEKSLLDGGEINMAVENSVWEYVPDPSVSKAQSLLVRMETPLRFRGCGRYTDEFSAKNFMNCLHKRTQTLVTQHGSNDFETSYTISRKTGVTERNHVWTDLDHYSTRQRKVIKLGGNSGSFSMEGVFTGYEMAMLHFSEIFHAGEQTSSGLGRLRVCENSEG
jgi:hypothetical protein